MKKIVLILAVTTLAVGCKKVSEGGNKGVLRMEEGAERYDAVERRGNGDEHQSHGSHTTVKEIVVVQVKGAKVNGHKNGLEEQIVAYLNSGAYDQAANDDALKSKWFNFDNVNFEQGKTDKLLPGSEEQLKNLALILKAFPTAKIKIGGYTDNVGDKAVNQKISQGRAEFIRQELTKMGVGGQVVGAEGYGSEQAEVAADATDAARASDRKMAVRFAK